MNGLWLFPLGLLAGFFLSFLLKMFWPKKQSLIGVVTRVENKDRKFGADPFYLALWVKLGAKKPTFLLLTAEDLLRLIDRGNKNPEDQPDGSPSAT